MNRDSVYAALCRIVGCGDVAYADDVADELRQHSEMHLDDAVVGEFLDSLVNAGVVTVVPVDQTDGSPSRRAYGIPQNSL
ncbi:MAG: hypothetical protein ABI658_12940 [Acidimicrobiales bacterium]